MASASEKSNWLGRYITVQTATDAKVAAALQAALDSSGLAAASIEGKPGIGAAVRRAQLLGARGSLTKALAALYRTLGDIVRAGQLDSAEAAILAQLKDEDPILRAIANNADEYKVLREALLQTSERGVQAMMTRILESERPLSQRIYKSEALAKGQVSRVVNNHLARGSSAADLAKDVRGFFDPKVSGGVSSSARRLARTEINNAFHAQSIAGMQDRPWVNQAEWHLSKSHPTHQPYDKCDEYARIKTFGVTNIPPKPHPNCLCFVIPVVSYSENDLLAGVYTPWILDNVEGAGLLQA